MCVCCVVFVCVVCRALCVRARRRRFFLDAPFLARVINTEEARAHHLTPPQTLRQHLLHLKILPLYAHARPPSTQYGMDRKDGSSLASLLRELRKLDGLKWVRILYAYPSYFTDELIDEIATNPKVCVLCVCCGVLCVAGRVGRVVVCVRRAAR